MLCRIARDGAVVGHRDPHERDATDHAADLRQRRQAEGHARIGQQTEHAGCREGGERRQVGQPHDGGSGATEQARTFAQPAREVVVGRIFDTVVEQLHGREEHSEDHEHAEPGVARHEGG